MAMIIALALQKGGVGKTTTAAALAVELAQRGCRVLAVDLDPQASLTRAFGARATGDDPTTYEVLLNATVDPVFAVQRRYGVDLIPASLRLAGAESRLMSAIGRELRLRTALAQLRDRYEYILLDPPPSLTLLMVNTLTAADTVLIPLQAHPEALEAIGLFNETISEIQQLNPALHIGGIALTMHDARTSINPAIAEAARAAYGDLVFETTIPGSVKAMEAPLAGQPLPIYAPKSSVALAYASLADEVELRWPVEEVQHAS